MRPAGNRAGGERGRRADQLGPYEPLNALDIDSVRCGVNAVLCA